MLSAGLLKAMPLFAELPEEQVSALADGATVRRFQRGAFILRAGESPEGFYVVLAGRVKILLSNQEGDEVTLATVGPGEYLGEMGLLDDHPRSASVQALERCELVYISARDFTRCVSANPRLAFCFTQGLVRRLRQSNPQIASLALMDVYGRVARLLLDLSEDLFGKRVIHKAPPKQEIAHMVGASREMVSRVMKHLQEAGHIRVDKRRILLLEAVNND